METRIKRAKPTAGDSDRATNVIILVGFVLLIVAVITNVIVNGIPNL